MVAVSRGAGRAAMLQPSYNSGRCRGFAIPGGCRSPTAPIRHSRRQSRSCPVEAATAESSLSARSITDQMWGKMWGRGDRCSSNNMFFHHIIEIYGCPTRIRTLIDGVRVRSLTIRGSGIIGGHMVARGAQIGGGRRVVKGFLRRKQCPARRAKRNPPGRWALPAGLIAALSRRGGHGSHSLYRRWLPPFQIRAQPSSLLSR